MSLRDSEHNNGTFTGYKNVNAKQAPMNIDTNEKENTTTTTPGSPSDTLYHPEETLKLMDEKYETEFTRHVRNEKNAKWVGQGLARVIKDTQLVNAVWGIRWVTSKWHIYYIATLLKHATNDWTVHERAQITNLVSNDWPLSPHTSRLAFHMVQGTDTDEMVSFIVRMTTSWTIDAALHLLSEIAYLEDWPDMQLVEVAKNFGGVAAGHRNMKKNERTAISEFCAKAAAGLVKADWLPPSDVTED